MQGKLAATAVNAPMVPAEVLAELQPFVALAQGLGRAAVQLVAEKGFTDINITYASPRGDDLDTRLLRAMVIKVDFPQQTLEPKSVGILLKQTPPRVQALLTSRVWRHT